jgi:hypothetical protein
VRPELSRTPLPFATMKTAWNLWSVGRSCILDLAVLEDLRLKIRGPSLETASSTVRTNPGSLGSCNSPQRASPGQAHAPTSAGKRNVAPDP